MKHLIPLLGFLLLFSACNNDPADLILINGDIYTMEESQPWANAVSITGNTISGVYKSDKAALRHDGPNTKVIDLEGSFVVPGFIDGHVHFNRSGELINDANLMTIADEEGLRKEIERVTSILEPGEWITGGLWGAYELWAQGAKDASGKPVDRWHPNRNMIDDLTEKYPCLLYNFDYTLFLANTVALELSGLSSKILSGMHSSNGVPTGLIEKGSPAIQIIRQNISQKSHERMLNENRAALKALTRAGITEIHDIATPSQTKRFIELQKNDELTCRVWLRPDLSRGTELKEQGLTMGLHPATGEPDSWLRYGALKGYIDGIMGTHGALFFEPYDDQPDNDGHYRRHTSDDPSMQEGNMEKMYQLIKTGYEGGFVSNVHAIGDKGVSLMLDTYERLKDDLGQTLDGFRVIHAQVIRPNDFSRFKELNVIAEINPYHISDDMRWMEERIGYERCKGAYAFQSLLENGTILSFGSDWPGTSAAEYYMHPKYLIHAAVNRTTLKGEPEDGWFPEQKISMHEALKAYTINNAYAAFEDSIRGSITTGKLADIAVCSINLMEIDSSEILNLEILMTIVDGKIVYTTY